MERGSSIILCESSVCSLNLPFLFWCHSSRLSEKTEYREENFTLVHKVGMSHIMPFLLPPAFGTSLCSICMSSWVWFIMTHWLVPQKLFWQAALTQKCSHLNNYRMVVVDHTSTSSCLQGHIVNWQPSFLVSSSQHNRFHMGTLSYSNTQMAVLT